MKYLITYAKDLTETIVSQAQCNCFLILITDETELNSLVPLNASIGILKLNSGISFDPSRLGPLSKFLKVKILVVIFEQVESISLPACVPDDLTISELLFCKDILTSLTKNLSHDTGDNKISHVKFITKFVRVQIDGRLNQKLQLIQNHLAHNDSAPIKFNPDFLKPETDPSPDPVSSTELKELAQTVTRNEKKIKILDHNTHVIVKVPPQGPELTESQFCSFWFNS